MHSCSRCHMKRFVLILLGCLVHLSASLLTFEAMNSLDGQWKFEEGSNVTLQCTNIPYTGAHTFYYDSNIVHHCTGTTCYIVSDNQGDFLFNDTIADDKSVFTWIIIRVKTTYNGQQFACDNEKSRKNITVAVEKKSQPISSANGNRSYLGLIVLLFIQSMQFLIISLIFIY